MELTQEQVKEFWEQCEVKFDWHPQVTRPAYQTPGGEWHFGKLPIDLNNLFQYAVPKAVRIIMEKHNLNEFFARRFLLSLWLSYWDEDPAPALSQAIYEALGGELGS